MRKISILLVLCLSLCMFAGCSKNRNSGDGGLDDFWSFHTETSESSVQESEDPDESSTTESTPTEPSVTEPPVTDSVVTEPPATEPITEPPVEDTFEPYIVDIPYNFEIHEGPGYRYSLSGYVDEAGLYTIVEERLDGYGNRWGKLKSGAGWIDLDLLANGGYRDAPMVAGYAGNYPGTNYYYYVQDTSEYAVSVLFEAQETLKNVTLFTTVYDEENGWEYSDELYYIEYMTTQIPLIAELAFYGDATEYRISFEDERGEYRIFAVYISGYDGSLVFTEQ